MARSAKPLPRFYAEKNEAGGWYVVDRRGGGYVAWYVTKAEAIAKAASLNGA